MGFRGCFKRNSRGTDLNTLCSDEYGDPMGFALDPLDPLEQGVALELVVHWTRWFISVITSTSVRYIRGTI
jgi:hypothetical protein